MLQIDAVGGGVVVVVVVVAVVGAAAVWTLAADSLGVDQALTSLLPLDLIPARLVIQIR